MSEAGALRVLIVDADGSQAAGLIADPAVLLTRVTSLAEAVKAVAAGSFDAVLLDVAGSAPIAALQPNLTEQQDEQAVALAEAQRQQAVRMEAVGRLAGGVAHDFNNVLTAIFGYADLLLDEFDTSDPRRSDVVEIKRAAERAAALTRQLLAFSRKQILQPRVVLLNDVIAAVRMLLERLLTDDVQLSLALAADLWHVRADPGQIDQVLMNLCANARDAMAGGGRLVIETANVHFQAVDPINRPGLSPGDYVAVIVSDTGHGMPEEVRAHVFEPFFTTKPTEKGTGLGLATVYGIVKQSGGGVYVDSEVGQGTRFAIYLPRVPEDIPGAEAPGLRIR